MHAPIRIEVNGTTVTGHIVFDADEGGTSYLTATGGDGTEIITRHLSLSGAMQQMAKFIDGAALAASLKACTGATKVTVHNG